MSTVSSDKATVLVVDDVASNVLLLRETLKPHCNVLTAYSGMQALQIASANPKPDLILLDVMMMDMDGYEVLQQLKIDERTCNIPVIFLTALSNVEDELKGLELGALDYIYKPFCPAIVDARVRTHLDLLNAKNMLRQQNLRLLEERELVENIVTHMRAAKSFDTRSLQYLVSPVNRTNGDILLAAYTPDGRQWVLLGDFTGHGLPAAVATPLVSYIFYNRVRENVCIEQAILELSEVLYSQLPTDILMAWSMLEVAASRQQIRLWSGGMPPVCVLDDQRAVTKTFKPNMLPMGILPNIDLADGELFSVSIGDSVYMYSDGVTEVANPQGELFGAARLKQFLIQKSKNLPLDALFEALGQFHQSGLFDDDLTLVEVTI